MIIDITGTPLIPGNHGWACPGNGNHPDIECCCEECDYMLCCLDEHDPNQCGTCNDPDCPRASKHQNNADFLRKQTTPSPKRCGDNRVRLYYGVAAVETGIPSNRSVAACPLLSHLLGGAARRNSPFHYPSGGVETTGLDNTMERLRPAVAGGARPRRI